MTIMQVLVLYITLLCNCEQALPGALDSLAPPARRDKWDNKEVRAAQECLVGAEALERQAQPEVPVQQVGIRVATSCASRRGCLFSNNYL